MKYLKKLILLLIVLTGCGTEPEPITRLLFSPDKLTIDVGTTGDVKLKIKDLEDSIFAVSMQIDYDSTIVSFNHSTGFDVGDFFGNDIVIFIEEDISVIHIALTLTQGQSEERGSGYLGDLTFMGNSPGSSAIEIVPTEFAFYDSEGNEVTVPDLEIETAEITVQ